jgi:hypothetical protein
MTALNDRQLRLLHEAAALLQPAQRDVFMRNVVTLFAARGDLVEAVRMCLSSFGIAAGKQLFRQGRAR